MLQYNNMTELEELKELKSQVFDISVDIERLIELRNRLMATINEKQSKLVLQTPTIPVPESPEIQ